MLRDLGSRDERFLAVSRRVLRALVELADATETHVCVPMQGSGTFAVEAMIGTLVPRDGGLLVLINGNYGHRMAEIARRHRRRVVLREWPEDRPVCPIVTADALESEPGLSHVAVVYCETTSGIRNPIEEIASVVARHGRGLLIDAMSAFGALPLDARRVPFEAAAASANKCLEGVPGVGFCIARRGALERAAGNSLSLSLDLHDQHKALARDGQWRGASSKRGHSRSRGELPYQALYQ